MPVPLFCFKEVTMGRLKNMRLGEVDLTNYNELLDLELELDKDKRHKEELRNHPSCDDPYHPGCKECMEKDYEGE